MAGSEDAGRVHEGGQSARRARSKTGRRSVRGDGRSRSWDEREASAILETVLENLSDKAVYGSLVVAVMTLGAFVRLHKDGRRRKIVDHVPLSVRYESGARLELVLSQEYGRGDAIEVRRPIDHPEQVGEFVLYELLSELADKVSDRATSVLRRLVESRDGRARR